jgi:SAM-dependent methyltransferase
MDNRSENESARHDPAAARVTVRSLPRKLANRVRKLLRWLGVRPSPQSYWETRATTHGARSVLDLRHSDAELAAVTARQSEILLPLLRDRLEAGDRRVLDFGCGPGRFTPALAELTGGTALGVDPVARYLEIAPRAAGVEYLPMEGTRIPAGDSSCDVVWICIVLGGIVSRRELERTVREIDRVLRPGGLLFVVENTSDTRDGYYWRYRSANDYRRLFPSVALAEISHYVDIDQRMSVLAGRKR